MENLFADAPVISTYTRANAIDDGELIDVSSVAKEAGIKFPVAITRAVHSRYVEFDPRAIGQDEAGRLWDLMWMLRYAIKRASGPVDRLLYTLHVATPAQVPWQANEQHPERGSGLSRHRHRLVTLKAICGPGDTPEPVITVMLPDED